MYFSYYRKKIPGPLETLSSSNDSDSADASSEDQSVQYYNGNLLLPIFSADNKILSPVEVMNILFNVGRSVSTQFVCTHQPLHVEHNRTFVVDLESLKSHEDVKCDDIGSWKNQSQNKFCFTKDENKWLLMEKKDEEISKLEFMTLKRQYFSLQGDEEDFRRRIDIVTSKLIIAVT